MIQTSAYPEKVTVNKDDLEERRRLYLIRWNGISAERERHRKKWIDLNDYILPERGRFLGTDHNKPKDTSKILNNTPTRAFRGLAAGLMAGCTPRARPWLEHTVPDDDLAKWGPVNLWLWEYTRRQRKILELSGFYQIMSQCVYPDMACFGLGTMLQEEDPLRLMRFVPLAIGSYGLAQDGDGVIDTLYYEEPWTVAELVKEFDWNRLSPSVRTLWNNRTYEQYISVLRVIEPNSEFVPGGFGAKGMKWGSVWIELGGVPSLAGAAGTAIQDSTTPGFGFLRESGYSEFPVHAGRWSTTPRDVYPTGAGHDALPDCKQVMQLERRSLLAVAKGVNPTMLIPEMLRSHKLSMLPGDAVYVPSGMTQKVESAFTPHQDAVNSTEMKIRQAEQRIMDAAYGDLMRRFTEERQGEGVQPPSAEEIVAQKQEIMLLLGPVLDNMNDFLTRVSERTHAMMVRARILPPAPKEIRGMKLIPRFVSVLFQAQKMIGIQARERSLVFLGQLAQLKGPDAVDTLDVDKFADGFYDEIGLPPDCVTPMPIRLQARQQRQQQAEAQQQGQAMMAAAQGAKDAAKAQTGEGAGDNLLTRLLGPMAGAQAGGGQ